MHLKLEGKLSLVSGSTAGIGHAIARALAAEGARVIVNGRSQASVDAAVAGIQAGPGGEVLGFAGDLGTAAAAQQLVQKFPGIEILVNNLGIFEPKAFEDIPDEDWTRFFEVNVLSGVRLARLCLPAMRAANWGRIIFISSESAVQIPAEMVHYGMTKTAQLAVSRGLAESVAGTGITVNSVLPGPTRSRGVGDFVQALAKEKQHHRRSFREGVLQDSPPHVADQAVRDTRGDRQHGRLHCQPARLRHDGCRAARGRRLHQERVSSARLRRRGCRARARARCSAASASGSVRYMRRPSCD